MRLDSPKISLHFKSREAQCLFEYGGNQDIGFQLGSLKNLELLCAWHCIHVGNPYIFVRGTDQDEAAICRHWSFETSFRFAL